MRLLEMVNLYPFVHGMVLGILAMLLHELGHIVCAVLVGVRVKKIGIAWRMGLYTVREAGPVSKNMLIAAAGPLVNMLLVGLWQWWPIFGLANFCYALANLLPIEGSDGTRIVRCWMQIRGKGMLT